MTNAQTSNGFNSVQEVLHEEKLHDHKLTEIFEHSAFTKNVQDLNLWLYEEPNRTLCLKSRTPFCCSVHGKLGNLAFQITGLAAGLILRSRAFDKTK